MANVTTTEADIEKVCRIARELGIGLEEAAITCDAFELAFSDDRMRRAIFEIVDQLDESAAKKGEPAGLIINYTVELGMEGIRVGRYADEIPAGEIVELTPAHRARILLKINDNFPTQEFLGPLIVNRPEFPSVSEPRAVPTEVASDESQIQNPKSKMECGSSPDINKLPSLDKEGCPVGRGGLIPDAYSDIREPEILEDFSPFEPPRQPICLGPIRLKFYERFPFVSATQPSSQPAALPARTPAFQSRALNADHHLPPWAALQAGTPAFQSTSGLSPPPAIGESGHSASKDVLRPLALTVETYVSHLDL